MRKRKYIPYPEKLAATLACLLPQDQRDDLRANRVPASQVISLFHFDHIALHSFGGSDLWWNLDPRQKESHRIKSNRDNSIAAKAKRIDEKWSEFTRAMASGQKPPRKPSRWPNRKFGQRFPPPKQRQWGL